MIDRSTGSDARIYLRSLELIDLVARVLQSMPPGYAFLADQIRRSASSIPLNYLEGFAIGSAHEVAATLDVMQRFGVLASDHRSSGQDVGLAGEAEKPDSQVDQF